MLQRVAASARALDPRLKMGAALVLGPLLWAMHPLAVGSWGAVLLPMVWALSLAQPLGSKMIFSLFGFVVFWCGMKFLLDAMTGLPIGTVVGDSLLLGVRLSALLLLGLSLALSTSARLLGLAVSWALRPFLGRERAWKVALSLALMVHFLPLCLSTMNQVKQTLSVRCPDCGFFRKMVLIPQAVLRALGQKTWNQTLAVACRGLENGDAWQPDFAWNRQDTVAVAVVSFALVLSSL